MTDFTTNPAVTIRNPLAAFAIVGRVFASMFAGYKAYLTYTQLSRLSDRQLSDIGLTRADLPRRAAAQILDN